MTTILLIALYLLIGAWVFQYSYRNDGDITLYWALFLWPISLAIYWENKIEDFLIEDAERRK